MLSIIYSMTCNHEQNVEKTCPFDITLSRVSSGGMIQFIHHFPFSNALPPLPAPHHLVSLKGRTSFSLMSLQSHQSIS